MNLKSSIIPIARLVCYILAFTGVGAFLTMIPIYAVAPEKLWLMLNSIGGTFALLFLIGFTAFVVWATAVIHDKSLRK